MSTEATTDSDNLRKLERAAMTAASALRGLSAWDRASQQIDPGEDWASQFASAAEIIGVYLEIAIDEPDRVYPRRGA